jgi:hypothetical protein
LLAAHGVEPVVVTPPDGLDLNAWALADPTWVRVLANELGVDDTSTAVDRRTAAPVVDLAVGIEL